MHLFAPSPLYVLWQKGLSKCIANPPDPSYSDWDNIDHAPIEYIVG